MIKKYLMFFIIIIFSACSLFTENEDRLEGYFAKDPLIGFDRYYLKDFYLHDSTYYGKIPSFRSIDTLHNEDTIFVSITEFNRSDGKPSPQDGSLFSVKITTISGDIEIFKLDSSTDFLIWADNMTPYIKFLNYQITAERPHLFNGRIEINSRGDKITAEYASYWHGHIVNNTLIYSMEE